MSILFYGKKTALDSTQKLSIYLRVTINGERFKLAHNDIEPAKWSVTACKAKIVNPYLAETSFLSNIIQ